MVVFVYTVQQDITRHDQNRTKDIWLMKVSRQGCRTDHTVIAVEHLLTGIIGHFLSKILWSERPDHPDASNYSFSTSTIRIYHVLSKCFTRLSVFPSAEEHGQTRLYNCYNVLSLTFLPCLYLNHSDVWRLVLINSLWLKRLIVTSGASHWPWV